MIKVTVDEFFNKIQYSLYKSFIPLRISESNTSQKISQQNKRPKLKTEIKLDFQTIW